MTKPMTPEELREKLAREAASVCGIRGAGQFLAWKELTKAGKNRCYLVADNTIQTFLQFCDENNIYQLPKGTPIAGENEIIDCLKPLSSLFPKDSK